MSQSLVTTARRWLVLVGGGLTLAACVIIGTAYADLTLFEIIRWPGDGTLIVVGFVTIAMLIGAFIMNMNFIVKNDEFEVPEPETVPSVPSVPRAGTEFDRIVENRLLVARLPAEERHRIRERLRQTAIRTIQRTAGVSRSQATTRIARGEWTENTTAAAFLGQTESPRLLRLCGRVSRRFVFRHSIRQTTRAIVTYASETKHDHG